MSNVRATARTRVPRFAGAAVERARLTVVPRRQARAARAPFAALVIGLLAAGVVGLLMFNTHMQQLSFRATDLQTRADALVARQQSLGIELQALRDPQRLAVEAKNLGLVAPVNPAFVKLADGTVLGTPTPATPDDAMRINPLPPTRPKALAPKPRIVIVRAPRRAAAGTTKPTDTGATSGPGRAATGRKAVTQTSTAPADAPGTGATR